MESITLGSSPELHRRPRLEPPSPAVEMGRSARFNLGATYSSHRPKQQQQHAPSVSSSGVSFTPGNNQDLLHVHGSDMFPSSHSSYHSQWLRSELSNKWVILDTPRLIRHKCVVMSGLTRSVFIHIAALL
ncbi:hypothetical protein L484_005339 [Morus notabilis]|uniref:Uncharacterized protein n=1 Tax=Morus notabilis TaxID=981085 RepID=W9RH84_9ROSA|nr:hypothetical protein L484_005339 [Morus notabilis]